MPDTALLIITITLACLLAGATASYFEEMGRRHRVEAANLELQFEFERKSEAMHRATEAHRSALADLETERRVSAGLSESRARALEDLRQADEQVAGLRRTVREYDQVVAALIEQIAALSITTLTPLGGAREIAQFVDRLARTDTLTDALGISASDLRAGAHEQIQDVLDRFVNPIRLSARALLRVRPNFPMDTFHTYVQLIEIGCGFSLEQLLAQAYTAPECHHLVLNPDLIAAMAERVRNAASLSAARAPFGSEPRPIEPKTRVRALEL